MADIIVRFKNILINFQEYFDVYDLQSKEIEKIYDAFNLNGLLIDFEENTIRVVRELQKIKWFWNGKSAPTVSHCGYNNLKFDCALFEENL